MNTNELIAALSAEAPPKRIATPRHHAAWLIATLLVYAVGAQLALGLRPDLSVQLGRPSFALEIALLALIVLSSTWAAILSMYPDIHQKKRSTMNLPFVMFALLVLGMLGQLLMLSASSMIAPLHANEFECALCIASVAIIPSAVIFGVLRKGASVHPLRSGAFAVLAAAGIGGLTLRLSEANDSLIHLTGWHYLPTLLCAGLGAWVGRALLKW